MYNFRNIDGDIKMSIDSRLTQMAINNHKSATSVKCEYLICLQVMQNVFGEQYKTRYSHIKYFAFKSIESVYKK